MSTINKKLTSKYEQKVKLKTEKVLGYPIPQFTEDEWNLRNKYKAWESWMPNMKGWSGDFNDDWYIVPQPEKPVLSAELIERIKMRDEWVNLFNRYYDNP